MQQISVHEAYRRAFGAALEDLENSGMLEMKPKAIKIFRHLTDIVISNVERIEQLEREVQCRSVQ